MMAGDGPAVPGCFSFMSPLHPRVIDGYFFESFEMTDHLSDGHQVFLVINYRFTLSWQWLINTCTMGLLSGFTRPYYLLRHLNVPPSPVHFLQSWLTMTPRLEPPMLNVRDRPGNPFRLWLPLEILKCFPAAATSDTSDLPSQTINCQPCLFYFRIQGNKSSFANL